MSESMAVRLQVFVRGVCGLCGGAMVWRDVRTGTPIYYRPSSHDTMAGDSMSECDHWPHVLIFHLIIIHPGRRVGFPLTSVMYQDS